MEKKHSCLWLSPLLAKDGSKTASDYNACAGRTRRTLAFPFLLPWRFSRVGRSSWRRHKLPSHRCSGTSTDVWLHAVAALGFLHCMPFLQEVADELFSIISHCVSEQKKQPLLFRASAWAPVNTPEHPSYVSLTLL